jgi:hypothetical protein
MAIKKEFHTISISIPSNLVNISKGVVSSVKSLTKSGNLTTKEGKKSVILETNKGNEVIVQNQGRTINTIEEKRKSKDRKERAKLVSESRVDKELKKNKPIEKMTTNELEDLINNGSISNMSRRVRANKKNRPSVRIDGLPRKQRSSKK